MKRQGVILLVLVAFVSFLSGGWLLQRGSEQKGSVYQKARLFNDILAHVADYYVDSLDERYLYDLAIDGMLNELNDPYTTFLREKEYRDLTLSTTGNYAGLGIQIGVRDGWVTVIAPLPDTPAERAGITSGDRIVAVDGESTYGWKDQDAVRELRGDAGSKVQLSIGRPGMEEPLSFTITRAKIHVKSVRIATRLEGGVGYLQLNTVSEASPQEVTSEVARLIDGGATSLILDVRENPGGLLDQGVTLADLFLDPDQAVVETRGRGSGATRTYSAKKKQTWPDLPIVVLVGQGTASAAEIIAGALQDHDRALILGTPTYGKGLVQTLFQLSKSQALKITTARWFTPSGRSIQRPSSQDSVLEVAKVDSLPPPADSEVDGGEPSDTAAIYRTSSGRVLQGGGGIYPDIVVQPALLNEAERAFVRVLGSNLQAYRDVLTAYALEYKADGGGGLTDPGFRVSASMRADVLRRLRDREVEIPDSVWTGVQTLVNQQIGYEVAHYVFDKEAEFKRRAADDLEVLAAIELLGRASTTAELIALAEEPVEAAARQ